MARAKVQPSLVDEQFGTLTWDDFDEVWATSVAIPYFEDAGQNLEAKAVAESDDPLDPTNVRGTGEFLLQVETASARRPPSEGQREAWRQIVERGEAFWQELMAALLEEYRLQQPIRARWWKAVYGEHQLERALPEQVDLASLKHLVRPQAIRIGTGSKKAEARVSMACTWNQDPMEVRVRGGKVCGMEAGMALPSWESAPKKLKHPVFGPLGRRDDTGPWTGTLECRAFCDYLALIAEQRASFRHDPEGHGPPHSVMPWEFVHGRFELRVHAAPGQEPTEPQAGGLAAFQQDEVQNVAAIVEAIFQEYREVYPAARRGYLDRYAEDNVPPPTGIDILHDRLQLYQVHVFPEDSQGHVKLGFLFVALWYLEPDLAVRWIDGRVEAVGSRGVGVPQRG